MEDWCPRRFWRHLDRCNYVLCTRCGCEYSVTAGTDPAGYVCPDCADYPAKCAALRARLGLGTATAPGAGDSGEKKGKSV